jgi:hypothetical protein
MKIKVVVVDLEIPLRVKKWAMRIAIPAVVLTAGAIALAASPLHVWNSGDNLKSSDLNANFASLQSQITTANYAPRTPSAFRAELRNQNVDVQNLSSYQTIKFD